MYTLVEYQACSPSCYTPIWPDTPCFTPIRNRGGVKGVQQYKVQISSRNRKITISNRTKKINIACCTSFDAVFELYSMIPSILPENLPKNHNFHDFCTLCYYTPFTLGVERRATPKTGGWSCFCSTETAQAK